MYVSIAMFLLFRLMFVQAHVSNLRAGVGAPRNDKRRRLFASLEQRVLDHNASHKVGRMSKLKRRTHIAGSVDHRVRRLHVVIDRDASLVILDADGLQIQTFDVGGSSDGYQNLIDGFVVFPAVRFDTQSRAIFVSERQVLAATQQMDTVPFHRRLNDLRRIAIFAWQNARFRFHEKYF